MDVVKMLMSADLLWLDHNNTMLGSHRNSQRPSELSEDITIYHRVPRDDAWERERRRARPEESLATLKAVLSLFVLARLSDDGAAPVPTTDRLRHCPHKSYREIKKLTHTYLSVAPEVSRIQRGPSHIPPGDQHGTYVRQTWRPPFGRRARRLFRLRDLCKTRPTCI